MYIHVENITLDHQGYLSGNGSGFRNSDDTNTDTHVNLGKGTHHYNGASGGGHGGTSGRGGGIDIIIFFYSSFDYILLKITYWQFNKD